MSEELSKVRMKSPDFMPRLDIIKANDRPDTAVGFDARMHEFTRPNMQEIFDRIRFLNSDPSCHGILVQSPIVLAEGQQDQADVLSRAISVKKDVDGLHPMNLGSLALQHGQPDFYPCTPAGILEILRHYNIAVSGKRVVVIGRSRIVGMPTALMLNRCHATVTLCHSQTTNLPSILQEAELVIAAIGKPRFVKAEWIRRGAVIVDVGVNRIVEPDGRTRLVGDVDYEPVSKIVTAITPVPGGVGPMTVAMLVRNLYHATLKEHCLDDCIEERGFLN